MPKISVRVVGRNSHGERLGALFVNGERVTWVLAFEHFEHYASSLRAAILKGPK